MAVVKRALLVLVVLAGCEDFGRLRQLKPRRMVVKLTDVSFLPDGGQVSRPRPIDQSGRCEVAVDGLLGAGWQVSYGTWVSDGVCELRDVQPGDTYVRVPGRGVYFETALDEVDLGNDDVGRPYTSGRAGTAVTLDVTAGEPYEERTELAVYVPDFGVGFTGAGATVQATKGQTSFAVTYDWEGMPLVQAGEAIDFFQGRTEWDGGTDVRFRLTRKGTTTAVTAVDTRAVRAPVTMAPITATAQTPLPAVSADPDPLVELLTDAYPDATFLGTWAQHEVKPEGFTLPLGIQHHFNIRRTGMLSLPAFTLDPLPTLRWRGTLSLSAYVELAFEVPAAGTATIGTTIQGPANDLAWVTSTAISPAQALAVRDAQGRMQVSGEIATRTPVLVWDPPAIGLPNAYNVTIDRVDVSGSEAKLTRLPLRMLVQKTEAHIPPEVLEVGKSYVFEVLAENCTATDPKRPRRANPQLPCAQTQSASRVFTVVE